MIPHLYNVHNTETGEIYEVYAKDNLDAIRQVPGGPESDPLCSPFRTTEILTKEGYEITLVKFLKKGDYFNVIHVDVTDPKRPYFANKLTYVRDEYYRPEKKYFAIDFYNINHHRLLPGTTKVTIDVIF